MSVSPTRFIRRSRVGFLFSIVLVVSAIFVVQLFVVQVVRHDYYVTQADNEQIKKFTLKAQRGEIYAMDGSDPKPLVMNETVYKVWVDPTQISDKQAVVDTLNSVAGGNVVDGFAKLIDKKPSRYQILTKYITRTQAELIKTKKLAGIGFEVGTRRVYPEGRLASQVLGFVNHEGKGVYGFEQANNQTLSGRDGMLKTVTDARDVPLTIGDKNVRQPAVNGQSIVLTIDRNIQAQVESALEAGAKRSKATRASAIVMEPSTGKVLAMANMPTYDPSNINTSDVSVFNNDTISHPYEAGSDVKTFTVATGIDKGVISPQSTYNNTGKIKVEDITINNASKNSFLNGDITMQTALNWSLNTGMVTIAQLLGNGSYITRGARDTIYDYFYNRFRLGQLTGIELANEAGGTVISPAQQEGNAVRYSNMVFGQGMNVTMLQVASGFCSVVNGGVYHAPTIINGTIGDGGKFAATAAKTSARAISEASSQTVREMVHQAHYATYKPHDDSERWLVGGKTGTSQVIVNGKYDDNETIGTYLGFGGEYGKIPRYVIMVEIAADGRGMGGGSDAKPIFNEISNWMIKYLKLAPRE